MEVFIPLHGRKLGEGFSKAERLKAEEHPGRNTRIKGYQSPVSWISDLIDCKKAILLCRICGVKFDHRRHHYRPAYIPDISGRTDGYEANGNCDACKQFTPNCGGGKLYVTEESYGQLYQDPKDARRKARAAAGAMTAWQRIQRGRKN